MKVYRNYLLFGHVLILLCCTADYTKNLGGGYFFRSEGGDIKDILSTASHGGEIPSTVISFDYDGDFIIAKQRPKLPQDILYEKVYNYELGADTTYFWLIVKKSHLVLGPLSKEEFIELKEKWDVPENLRFKDN
ncbi:hypothetical protein KIH41_17385 [Litoribacter ruber]|uniref:hypothetical protein n=1 Tax=Litoribacter ruber TaxID=702568 RepID=UPI001BDAC5D6|nr:hypothetical protein [Litoribacter ruber]MBT0813065.1 hypothetical protein [Litoribacter ruber]